MDRFLTYGTPLADHIDASAAELYRRLTGIDVDQLGLPTQCLYYYKASHSQRLFFSIETSAQLLYRAVSISGRNVNDITVMDYGAGVGTLYLLAKLIGCKQVIYNDHLEEWQRSAALIAEAIQIKIDHYIVGDIDHCLDELDTLNIKCDLITSRNVLEHIYRLDIFFKLLHQRQPQAIVFSSTTANHFNPAAVLKHRLWHRKWERVYRGKRLLLIRRIAPEISAENSERLASATQGLAASDLDNAISNYRQTGQLPDPSIFASNTCDPENGVWAEHLITAEQYRELINEKNYHVTIEPGFWDTHYSKRYKNIAGKLLNRLISAKRFALELAPFIYVIARPKNSAKPQ